MNRSSKKLTLHRETLRTLSPKALSQVAGATLNGHFCLLTPPSGCGECLPPPVHTTGI